MSRKRKDSEVGFVHSLSPIKKKKNDETKLWYTFQLQTSPSKFKNCIGFNQRLHANVKHFESTGSPTKLLNINEKEETVFVNEVSSIISVPSGDVTFQKATEEQKNKAKDVIANAVDITLKDLPKLLKTQKVNVHGVLTLGKKPPKEVTKRNGSKGHVKEDCVIEDATGQAQIDIWENLTDKLESGKAYKLTNLTIKNYAGNTNLGTTVETTFTQEDLQLEEMKGAKLLAELNNEEELIVKEFKFVDKVNVFLTCQIKTCNKRMPYSVGCVTAKCQSCGTTQKVKFAKQGMSARLCTEVEGKDLWLTAFTDTMEQLKTKAGLSKDAKSDEIADGILALEDIKLLIDKRSKFVQKLIE